MLSKASKVTASIMGVGALALVANINSIPTFADNPNPENLNFTANVTEALSVAITVPEEWATGDPSPAGVNNLLRNKITLNVYSNNPNGFTASMTTGSDSTNLKHSSVTTDTDSTIIKTLETEWTRANTSTTNFWGYSIDDSELQGTYHPLVKLKSANPIELIARTDSIDANNPITSRDIYFGAKADTSKVAGEYTGTVVISVVSGIISEDNPVTPEHPVVPSDPTTQSDPENAVAYNESPTGGSANGTTTYTYTTTDEAEGTTTTTTNINDGNVVSSYSNPQGVVSNVNDNSVLTTALAATASVAAAAGVVFLVLAKRKKDDEE